MGEPILLLSPKLGDMQKSRTSRDGLIQQIVTYVRDGRTVTRKQWVRSEFADHAKKDQEERRKQLLKEEKENKKNREKEIASQKEKQATQDKRSYKKLKDREDKEEGHHGGAHNHKLDVAAIQHVIDQNKKKPQDDDKDKKKDKDKDKDKQGMGNNGKQGKKTAYGTQEHSRQENKKDDDTVLSPLKNQPSK